ncbi:MAG TPA: HD domain-containing protein [Clostridiaceae bacterium]|jgi:putative hydrolase of HD superfamily|nr:HD domain-containing protein [Clostridiaceae bacterium]
MAAERLKKQIQFILETDKIKNIFRMSKIHDGSRRENDAEHSWHLALMAFLLSEYSGEDIDILKVMKMCIIHDIVEIDAGDTFCYDAAAGLDKLEREQKAAKRIFGLLPEDQSTEFMELWQEFDAMETPEAKYAAALDRLQPVFLNYLNKGGTWQEHNVTKKQVLQRIRHIEKAAPKLWEFVIRLIEDAVSKGFLAEK